MTGLMRRFRIGDSSVTVDRFPAHGRFGVRDVIGMLGTMKDSHGRIRQLSNGLNGG